MSGHVSVVARRGAARWHAAGVGQQLRADPLALARWLPAMALTILDAALTYAWLRSGVAAEANPWLATLVETSGPGSAMAVRAGLGTSLVGLLAVLAVDQPFARRGLALVTGVLGLVVCWHVAGGAMVALAV